jgi:hypothetical protein
MVLALQPSVYIEYQLYSYIITILLISYMLPVTSIYTNYNRKHFTLKEYFIQGLILNLFYLLCTILQSDLFYYDDYIYCSSDPFFFFFFFYILLYIFEVDNPP